VEASTSTSRNYNFRRNECNVKYSVTSPGIILCSVAALFLFVFQDISLAARHPTAKTPERYESINIVVPDSLMKAPVVRIAVKDTHTLLRRGFPNARITLNAQASRVRIVLPDPEQMRNSPSPGPKPHTRYPLLHSPWQGYHWDSHRRKDFIELRLHATSPQGIACGLYGLLQERLGFKFIHPRQTIFPRHYSWPLPPDFHWNATPRFENRGFHLHTLHPTELAEHGIFKGFLDWEVFSTDCLFARRAGLARCIPWLSDATSRRYSYV
jgi:hypothetical protein